MDACDCETTGKEFFWHAEKLQTVFSKTKRVYKHKTCNRYPVAKGTVMKGIAKKDNFLG